MLIRHANIGTIQEPKWRVKTLLTKLESDRRNGTDYFTHKFMGKVQEIFAGLPKPKDLRSFEGNDLPLLFTASEVQQFAAEVGRLILKLQENSNDTGNSNLENQWILELAKNSGISQPTAYNWWSSFTKSAGLSITPKQATEKAMAYAMMYPIAKHGGNRKNQVAKNQLDERQ